MPDKFEITVPLPPQMVIKRLEAARKSMAPKIGNCAIAKDKSSFTCKIVFAYAYAIFDGQAKPSGEETKVYAAIHGEDMRANYYARGIGILITIIGFLLVGRLGSPVSWVILFYPALLFVGIPLLFVPFSKYTLSRFVRDILLNETQT